MVPNERDVADMVAWMSRGTPKDRKLPLRIAKMIPMVLQCADLMREARASHGEIGELFARRLGFGEHVQRAVRLHSERWDGKGFAYHTPGPDVPAAAQIIGLARVVELCHSFDGRASAVARARQDSGTKFDPDIAGAFVRLAEQDDFWTPLEQDARQHVVLAMRPPTSAELRTEEQVDAVCEALADLADARGRSRWNHSADVAERTVVIAGHMGLSQRELRTVRWAALLHDLGMVAVPVGIAGKQDGLSAGEQEQLRLHAYYTERILQRVDPLRGLALEAASDHEWFNGQGYHHHLSGEDIPLSARIIAVADAWATAEQRLGGAPDPADVLASVQPLAGAHLDPACVEALGQSLTGSRPPAKSAARQAASQMLTDREIDVLQLLASGMTNPQIAQALVISRKTVEHHLEHIYSKLDLSNRTSAVAYAVHHGLV
jgi:HD-GYP domain-containing protein (c-di-GMP phosphodiesterase class II)